MIPRTAYDWEIIVFSPDGRLFQVEYAREAVKRGTTTIAIKYKGGIVFIVDKRILSRLIEPSSIEKIFKIDSHIGCAVSGLIADARKLVERARIEAQINRLLYDEPIQIKALVKRICDFKQIYTQYGGMRPFGATLLIGGIDKTGIHLFATDPSGAMLEYKAVAEGEGSSDIMKYFERKYRDSMKMKEAIDMGIEAIKMIDKKRKEIEIGIVDKKGFRKMIKKI